MKIEIHEDALLVGELTAKTSCVFAFGPDAYYEAYLVHPFGSGCILIREMSDAEAAALQITKQLQGGGGSNYINNEQASKRHRKQRTEKLAQEV